MGNLNGREELDNEKRWQYPFKCKRQNGTSKWLYRQRDIRPHGSKLKFSRLRKTPLPTFYPYSFDPSSPGLEHRLIVKCKLRIRTWDINLSLSMKFSRSRLRPPHHTKSHSIYFTNIKMLLNRLKPTVPNRR